MFPVRFHGFVGASGPGGPGRADRGQEGTDDLIAHGFGDGVAFQPGRLRGIEIAARRFPVRAGESTTVRKPAPPSHARRTSLISTTLTSLHLNFQKFRVDDAATSIQ
ncbi:hypothetical protein ACSYDW_08345 [Paeniglutamicibacter sp. R2-26]|uniref:hypothetical protein n=1 Tax=Paeniglutamicibacter sp. R2-26 TaxID=3144417 RepID=UPI003EE76594